MSVKKLLDELEGCLAEELDVFVIDELESCLLDELDLGVLLEESPCGVYSLQLLSSG